VATPRNVHVYLKVCDMIHANYCFLEQQTMANGNYNYSLHLVIFHLVI
jgi:hypothetical protein